MSLIQPVIYNGQYFFPCADSNLNLDGFLRFFEKQLFTIKDFDFSEFQKLAHDASASDCPIYKWDSYLFLIESNNVYRLVLNNDTCNSKPTIHFSNCSVDLFRDFLVEMDFIYLKKVDGFAITKIKTLIYILQYTPTNTSNIKYFSEITGIIGSLLDAEPNDFVHLE